MKHLQIIIAIGLLASIALADVEQRLGISSWVSWRPGQVSRTECPELRSVPLILHWNKLEPEPGKYAFEKILGRSIRSAHEDGLYVTLMIWVGPACPSWIYEKGVPKVYTDRDVNPLGRKMSKEQNRFPYYLAPEYKTRFFDLIDAFGKYVNALPPELRQRIILVQSAEGSTGDGQPYKGNPLDKQYAIPKETWNAFRLETWKRYRRCFPGIPILVNSDANGAEEFDWLLENMDTIGLKHGMFSHGYHVSDNRQRLERLEAIESAARERGISILTRGEMDAEMFVYAWSTRNIPQALYWSGLFATHCRLDIWNIPHKALKDKANSAAFRFFNKYAGQTDPATAPAAFCALRDGLDASDFQRFPVTRFGGKVGRKRDMERYLLIAKDYAPQGARMDDPEKALGGGMVNRKRSGSNDVGWGILPCNYSRFLTQINPGSGDVGLWNIDDSIYGRFGRSFDHKAGKKKMRFKLNPAFGADSIQIHVTYLDSGDGAWSLNTGGEDILQVQNSDSGEWKVGHVTLPSFRGDELLLEYEKGDDTVFHLIEIERSQ